MRIGVLAVQGAFREHARVLRRLGAEVVEVRLPEQLDGLEGLVLPGGESTAILRLMRLYGLDEAVRRFGRPILGTCAGMIVLDRERLGLIDLVVERNAFGRQVASFEADLSIAGEEAPFRAVFIRAPWVASAGPGVEILAEIDGRPVLAREGPILVASFHPELTDDTRIHERFLELVRARRQARAERPASLEDESGGTSRTPEESDARRLDDAAAGRRATGRVASAAQGGRP